MALRALNPGTDLPTASTGPMSRANTTTGVTLPGRRGNQAPSPTGAQGKVHIDVGKAEPPIDDADGVVVSEPFTFDLEVVVVALAFTCIGTACPAVLLDSSHELLRYILLGICVATQCAIISMLYVWVVLPIRTVADALTTLNEDLGFDEARAQVLNGILSHRVLWSGLRDVSVNLTLTCMFLAQVKPYIPESVVLKANEGDDDDSDDGQRGGSGNPGGQAGVARFADLPPLPPGARPRNPLTADDRVNHQFNDTQSLHAASAAPLSETNSVGDDGMSSVEDMTLRHNGLLGVLPNADTISLGGSVRSRRGPISKHKGTTRIVKATSGRPASERGARPTHDGTTDGTASVTDDSGTVKSSGQRSHISADVGASVDIYNAKASKRLLKLQAGDGFRVRNATILQVDLYGCEPQQVVNLFINSVSECTKYYGGIALTVTGSCFIATWNAFKSNHCHAVQACKCAIDFHQKLKSLTAGRANTVWRASIATGPVRVGFVGSESIRAPAVTGDAALLVSKLGLLGTQTGAKILLNNETYNLVRDSVFARPVEVISLESGSSPVSGEAVYELVSLPAHQSSQGGTPQVAPADPAESGSGGLVGQPEQYALYLEGISSLRRGAWHLCMEQLAAFIQVNPGDKQAKRLLKIASHYDRMDSPPGEYLRDFVGWRDLEAQAQGAPIPDDLSVQDLQDTVQFDYVREPELPDEHKLQDKIREASALAFGTPVAGEIDAPPNALIDTNGVKWLLLGKVLGSGAFGTVRLGMSSGGGLVAIKSMSKLQKCQEIVEEVGVMADLQHENTVQYLGSGLSHHTAFVVMEWVCGGSLKDVLKSCGGPLPLTVTKRYAQDILRGLRYLHHKSILHRDLKPHNVLVTPEGLCKLADFGASAKLSSALRKQGMVGTPMYMSPESCRGEAVQASDVWSFGITACQLLSYELPYQTNAATKFQSFLSGVASGAIVPVIPRIITDQTTRAFIEGCLERDPEKRPTCQDLLRHPYLL